jgi:hypothetical protein
MTDYRIIYPNDDDGIAVVIPAPGIEQTEALKAVPTGKPYLIIDASDIPTERTFRNAWQADFTDAPVKE